MQLITRVTAALRLSLRNGYPPCDRHLVNSWSVGQPRPFRFGNVIIIPAFNDGHMGFPATYLAEYPDGRIAVSNNHGREIFTDPRQAVQSAIMV